jgi:hypothetical protein
MNAGQFQNIADAGARFDAGTRPGGNHDNLATTKSADDSMRDRVASKGDTGLAFDGFLGVFGGLLDSRRNLIGLAIATGHTAASIAYDDQRVKAKAPTPFDHGGTTANFHDSVFQVALVARLAITISVFSHNLPFYTR